MKAPAIILWISVACILSGAGLWYYHHTHPDGGAPPVIPPNAGSSQGGNGGSWTFPGSNSGSAPSSNADNFTMLVKNLGGSIKPDSNGVVSVPFNSSKYQAQFYNNGRVIIFDAVSKNRILAGNYTNGGFSMKMENGKTVNNASVYTNLNLIAK